MYMPIYALSVSSREPIQSSLEGGHSF